MTQNVLLVASTPEELQDVSSVASDIAASYVDCIWLSKMQKPSHEGIRQLWVVELQPRWLPEDLIETLRETLERERYDILIFPATKVMREVCPRLAALLRAAYMESVINIEQNNSELIFNRFSYGGVAVQKIRARTPLKIITVVHHDKGKQKLSSTSETRPFELPFRSSGYSKRILSETVQEKAEDILTADRIVAVGRGIRKQEDISIVQELANVLQAKIACSRPLVEDYKWYPNEQQIGLSGNTVKPRLYIAIGISGQIQHIVGMRESKVIVAINKDKTAPIFGYADYGIVGDLYQIVPEIVRQLAGPRP